jgi:hypothetical protein
LCDIEGIDGIDGIAKTSKFECDQAVGECLSQPHQPLTLSGRCDPLTNCSATVGEVQMCSYDTLLYIAAFLDEVPSCEQFWDQRNTFPRGEPMVPESCTAISNTCPEVADLVSRFGTN